MYRFVCIIFLLFPVLVFGQDQDSFKFILPQPQTDPPNKAWASELVRRLQLPLICDPPCGGASGTATITSTIASTPTVTSTPTITATPTSAAFIVGGTCDETCLDSGGAGPGSLTITPACSLVILTVNDVDGCNVTISETGATTGRLVWIQNITANYARFASQVSVLVLPHEIKYLYENYVLKLKYNNSQWYDTDADAPASVYTTLKDITDPTDVPASFGTLTNECQFVCSSTLGGGVNGDLFISIPSFGPMKIMKEPDPCSCLGSGGLSVQVSTSGNAAGASSISIGQSSEALTDNSIAIGPNAAATTGNVNTAIGLNSLSTGSSSTAIGEGSISDNIGTIAIGQNSRAHDNSAIAIGGNADAGEDAQAFGPNSHAHGLNSIGIGNSTTTNGDADICIGPGAACSGGDNEIGHGQNAAPDGGVCIGTESYSMLGDFTFGGLMQLLHPVWRSFETTLGACGTGPTIIGNDVAGVIVVGSGTVTSCTVIFGNTWSTIPSCFANNETTIEYVQAVPGVSSLVLNASSASFDGDTIRYGCPVSYQSIPTRTVTLTPTVTPTFTPIP